MPVLTLEGVRRIYDRLISYGDVIGSINYHDILCTAATYGVSVGFPTSDQQDFVLEDFISDVYTLMETMASTDILDEDHRRGEPRMITESRAETAREMQTRVDELRVRLCEGIDRGVEELNNPLGHWKERNDMELKTLLDEEEATHGDNTVAPVPLALKSKKTKKELIPECIKKKAKEKDRLCKEIIQNKHSLDWTSDRGLVVVQSMEDYQKEQSEDNYENLEMAWNDFTSYKARGGADDWF